jgi:hypothetical protein
MAHEASEAYRPATRWCPPHPFGQQPWRSEPEAPCGHRTVTRWSVERDAERSRREVLLDLLEQSLKRGHWKLALRRYLMLLACGCEVPSPQRAACERHLRRCEPRGLRKMEEDVRAWSRCIA